MNIKADKVSKIAVINPYLQGGHTETAEMESIARFVQAAKRKSIAVKVLTTTQQIEEFDPDFVLGITYQEGKLSKYPTYLTLVIAYSLVKDVPRFIRNILTYDGYITASPFIVEWLKEVCLAHNKKPLICEGYFATSKTEYKVCDFKNATAMYMGTNWDGLRHKELFTLLADGAYLKCYGPKSSWSQYPASIYMGEVPFDGLSAMNFYHRHGIGLCFGMQECDDENVVNNRLYEVPASGAVIICAQNKLNHHMYGDAALYINRNLPTRELAEQITSHVSWVRANPAKAEEMARQTHSLFCNKFSMDYYLEEILAMHDKALSEKRFLPANKLSVNPKITYLVVAEQATAELEALFDDLVSQTYQNIEVIILASNVESTARLVNLYGKKIDLTPMLYLGAESNPALFALLQDKQTTWLGILTAKDRIFPNHAGIIIKTYQEAAQQTVSAVFTGSLENSAHVALPEVLKDDHNLGGQNTTRVAHLDFDNDMPLNALLIHVAETGMKIFKETDFFRVKSQSLINQLISHGQLLQACEITCSVQADSQKELAQALAQARAELKATTAQLYHMGNVFKNFNDEFLEFKAKQNQASDHLAHNTFMRFFIGLQAKLSTFKSIFTSKRVSE